MATAAPWRFWAGCVPCIAFSDRLLQNGIWDVKGNTLIDVPIGFQRQYRYTSVYSFEWALGQKHTDPAEAWEKAPNNLIVQLNAGHFCKVSHGMGRCRNEPWLARGFRTVKSSEEEG